MSDIPNDDQPGFVAEKPEHCFACYRLIRPGQIYCLTIGANLARDNTEVRALLLLETCEAAYAER